MWELNNGSSSQANALVLGQPLEAGIGASVLASLQNLKLGGN
jgi:hypothetical protein